jgi:hypothetical protein
MIRKVAITVLGTALFLVGTPTVTRAVPAFAKKYNLPCSGCHTVWPMLNEFGRRFKEYGYRLSPDQELSDQEHVKSLGMSLFKGNPLAVRVVGFLADKKKEGELRLRPFHEAEVFIAGNVLEKVSAFVEFEAEDEEGWEPAGEMGKVGLHLRPEVNVVAGYGAVLTADPYQPLNHAQFTRAHPMVVHHGFVADQPLGESTPFISVYGRVARRLFYLAGVSTGVGDLEGEDKKDWTARLAVDVTRNVTVGGLVLEGRKAVGEEETQKYRRLGVDFQVQFYRWSLMGAYLRASDEMGPGGPRQKDHVLYAQAYYLFFQQGRRPLVAPIVRIENYSMEGMKYTDGLLNLTVFPWENVKFAVEFWTNLSVPNGVAKSNRITFLVDTAF